MKKIITSVSAFLFSIAVLFSMLPAFPVTVSAAPGFIQWTNNSKIAGQDLEGGTKDSPLVIYVDGTVTLLGTINVTSGYVKFIRGSSAILKGEVNEAVSLIHVCEGAELSMENTEIHAPSGNQNGSGISIDANGSADLKSCYIQGFNGDTGCGISSSGTLTIDDSTIKECNYGLASKEGGSVSIINCNIIYNCIGIEPGGANVYLKSGTSVANNSVAGILGTSHVYVQGYLNISGWDMNQEAPICLNGDIDNSTFILMRNAGANGELAVGSNSHKLKSTDAYRFYYDSTQEKKATNCTIDGPAFADNSIKISRVPEDLLWVSSTVSYNTIQVYGGTEDNPITFAFYRYGNDPGSIPVDGTIEIVSGYVNMFGQNGGYLKGTADKSIPYIHVRSGAHLSISDFAVEVSSENKNSSGIFVDQGGSVTITNTRVRGFTGTECSGIFSEGTLTLNGCTVDTCYKGLVSTENGVNIIQNTEFCGNYIGLIPGGSNLQLQDGTKFTDNKEIDIQGSSAMQLQGNLNVSKWDLNHEAGISITGPVTGSITMTSANDHGDIAFGGNDYQLTASDAGAFHYVPDQIEKNTNYAFSNPTITQNNTMIITRTPSNVTWNAGTTVNGITLYGGTETEPVYVYVNGNVNLNGEIKVVSGYVNIVGQNDGTLKVGVDEALSYIHVLEGAHLATKDLTIEAPENNQHASGICVDPNGFANIADSRITGFTGTDVSGITSGGELTLINSTVENCDYGLSSTENAANFIQTSMFIGNRIGINPGGSDCVLQDKTVMKDSTEADIHGTSGVHLMGELSIEKFDMNQEAGVDVMAAVSGSICMTNINDQGELAVGNSEYTLIDSDVKAFSYVPTPTQETGTGIFSKPYLDSAKNRMLIDISYKILIELGATAGDNGYYFAPADDAGLNAKSYPKQTDALGTYYVLEKGEEAYFRVDIKKGFDSESMQITNGEEVLTALTAAELKAQGKEFTETCRENCDISQSRYFVVTGKDRVAIRVKGVTEQPRETDAAQIYACSLTLSGEIGVNFYVSIPEAMSADTGAYAMLNDQKVLLTDAFLGAVDTRFTHRFSYFVPLKEMNDDITLRLYDKDGKLLTLHDFAREDFTQTGYTYCVQDYIHKVLDSETQSVELKNMMAALSDFGNLAQTYFDYKTDQAAPLIHPDEIEAVTSDTLEPYQYTTTGSLPEGLGHYGSSVTLESMTTLTHHFIILDSFHSMDNYEFLVGDTVVTPVVKDNYYYCIEIENIVSKDLNKPFEVTVRKKGADSGYTISYSTISYANQVLKHNSDNVNLVKLVKAMYLYSMAADEYFIEASN